MTKFSLQCFSQGLSQSILKGWGGGPAEGGAGGSGWVAQLVRVSHQKVAGSIPSQGAYGANQLMFLSPSSSLKKKKNQ